MLFFSKSIKKKKKIMIRKQEKKDVVKVAQCK